MERWITDLIATFFILTIVGGFTLTVFWMKFRHDRKMKTMRGGNVAALADELAQLREESNAQIAELHERLDFAERLLAQQRAPALPPAPPAPKLQLRPRTPV